MLLYHKFEKNTMKKEMEYGL